MTTLNAKVILNVKTAAEWANSTEVLLEGELGIESDTRLIKIGNGVDTYPNLPYTAASDINDIEGVTVTSPTDGNVLTYSNGEWINITPSSLPADTDLSHYDNTTSEFITSSDIPALPADTDLSHYDNTNSDFATVSQIPTNVSELNNDIDYITSADLPTVGDGTITIQANSINIGDFTTNQNTNKTINITIPTNVSELNNDAGYVTSATLPTVYDGSLIIRQDGNTIATFTANSATNVVADITGGGASFIANAPLNYSGGVLSISAASSSQNGYLSAADWTSFDSKLSSTIFSSNNTWTGTNNVSSLFPRTDNSYSLGSNDHAFSEIYANFLYSNANDHFVIGNTSDDNRVLINYSLSGGDWGIFPDTEQGTTSYLGNSVYSWDTAYITNIHFSANNVIADDPNSTGLYIGWKNSSSEGRFIRFAENEMVPVSPYITLGAGSFYWRETYSLVVNFSSNVNITSVASGNGMQLNWYDAANSKSRGLQLVGASFRPSNTTEVSLGDQYGLWKDLYLTAGSSGGIYFGADTSHSYIRDVTSNTLVLNATGTVQIHHSGTQRYQFSNTNFVPVGGSSNSIDLGANGTGFRWNTVYYTTLNPTSDIRLKDNIEPLDSGLKIINDLDIKSFTYKNSPDHIEYGIIAQDVVEKYPELISVPKEDDGTYGTYLHNFIFVSLRAIQELSSKVDELNAKIKVLEGRV